MTATHAPRAEQFPGSLQVIPASAFHRLTEAEFGMPGLVAIESVGPFVEVASIGPFITIHDSFLDPGLGIGHHPHRGNERLFYILSGEIRHDDALNRIQGVMAEGDLARLTEGERGMLHKEWNGRDDVRTHAFILVYTPDVQPPIPVASFAAHRAADMPRVAEADGVETLHALGGRSSFRANSAAIGALLDSTLGEGASVGHELPPGSGLLVYPLAGDVRVATTPDRQALVRGVSEIHPEGPDGVAVAWAGEQPGTVTIAADRGPARVLRVEFASRQSAGHR